MDVDEYISNVNPQVADENKVNQQVADENFYRKLHEYISKVNQQVADENFYRKLNEDPTRKHSAIVNSTMENRQQHNGKSSTTQWKVLKNKSDCPLQLLKNFLQTTSEHHNFIFYQKYINEALKTSR